MEVASLYADRSAWPVFSAETFPPQNHRPFAPVLDEIAELLPHRIRVVSTTWGALGSPRGGTASLSRIIHERLNIPTVVHLNIQGKTKRDIEGILRSLHEDDVHNILALGGDPPEGVADYVPAELRHQYASDLVRQISCMNQGYWMGGDGEYSLSGVKTHFGIGVAGFPEVHPDDWEVSRSFDENMQRHLEHVRIKVDAGAHYIVEQMSFDAGLHFRYEEAVRKAGITIPVIPGILCFDRLPQAARFLGDALRISMPADILKTLQEAPDEKQGDLAADYMAEQVQKLLDAGVPGIHFYSMNRAEPLIALLQRVRC